MRKENKAKFRKNDVLFHEEQKKTLIVDGKTYMGDKGWLYTLRTVNAPNEGAEYKRYYEDKIKDNCSKLKNTKAIRILYGKK